MFLISRSCVLTACLVVLLASGGHAVGVVEFLGSIVDLVTSEVAVITKSLLGLLWPLPLIGGALLKATTFDYVIVGAGTAGSVLAEELSRDFTVAVVEAGSFETYLSRVPALCAHVQLTNMNWNYKTTPQQCGCLGMNNNQCTKPGGKALGGSSSINFMLYIKGNVKDYQCIKNKYNIDGWTGPEMMEIMRGQEKADNMNGFETSPYHGQSGKLTTRHAGYKTTLVQSYIDAMGELGQSYGDYNGECQLHVSHMQTMTNEFGERMSASRAYLEMAQTRSKLTIFKEATATKVIFNDATKQVTGVEVTLSNGLKITLNANKEVILSAGNFNTPKLLMLSGIGPRESLQRVGIPVRHELPVGLRTWEHTTFIGPLIMTNTTGQSLLLTRLVPHLLGYVAKDPNTRMSVPFGMIEGVSFVQFPGSRNPKGVPDIEYLFISGNYMSDFATGGAPANNLRPNVVAQYYMDTILDVHTPALLPDHFLVLMTVLHPYSMGSMTLQSANPKDAPLINPNILGDSRDVDLMYKAFNLVRKMLKTPAMRKIDAKLHTKPFPGCEHLTFGSKCYWRCTIRHSNYMYNHEISTARMGCKDDPGAVVDQNLRVRGMKGLRIVDISVWPCSTSSHTTPLAYAIGKVAANCIRDPSKCYKDCEFIPGLNGEDAEVRNVGDCANECQQDDGIVDDDYDDLEFMHCNNLDNY